MKKKVLSLLLFTLLMMTSCSSADSKSGELKFGTAGAGGTYNEFGTAFSEMIASDNQDLEFSVQETAGSAANIRLLSDGYISLAIAQSDIMNDAWYATGTFEDQEVRRSFRSIASLYTEPCQIVTRADAGIETIEDLADKTISIGEKESGSEQNAVQILNAYGLTEGKYTAENMNYADAASALKEGTIDAFFVTIGAPNQVIEDLAATTNIRLVPLEGKGVESLLEDYPFYTKSTIPAGTYQGLSEDITTVGIKACLLVSDKMSEETAMKLTASLFNHAADLQEVLPVQLEITPAEAAADYGIPFHIGAAAYYETQGLTVEIKKGDDVPPPAPATMFTFKFDMYQTTALAVVALLLGNFLRKKIKFLRTFCIPAPVVGGIIFAVLSCILYASGVVELSFDETLRTVFMVVFFASVGFQANLRVLKSGGISLIILLALVAVMITSQNFIAVGVSKLLNLDPLIGLCTGSIPMVGGHGTAGAFGPVLEDFGVQGATTMSIAAATFGLIAGSLMGGPIANGLISRKNLLTTVKKEDDSLLEREEEDHKREVSMYAPATFQIVIAVGLGTIVSFLLSKTGMTFPVYIGAMIVAAIMRNIAEFSGKFKVYMGEINDLGGICLSLFLGIAMITLKLWQLVALALPLVILLLAQAVWMFVFARFVVFNAMGRDYDAAIITAGCCGFGMGATPNAMANMQATCEKYEYSVKAFLIIPIVGSLFADVINSTIITLFINLV